MNDLLGDLDFEFDLIEVDTELDSPAVIGRKNIKRVNCISCGAITAESFTERYCPLGCGDVGISEDDE